MRLLLLGGLALAGCGQDELSSETTSAAIGPRPAISVPKPSTPARAVRSPAERVAVLPKRFEVVGWFGGDEAPLLSFIRDQPGGAPPCVKEATAGLEGYFHASEMIATRPILLFQGTFERSRVETCLPTVAEQVLGLQIHMRRMGELTEVALPSGETWFLGWMTSGDVVWDDDKAVVEEVLAAKDSPASNPSVASLLTRVNGSHPIWMVAPIDLTTWLVGVPSKGFFLSTKAKPGVASDPLVMTFAFETPAEATRAAKAFTRGARDARFSERLQSVLLKTVPTAKGTDVEVNVAPIMFEDVALMQELVEVMQASLAKQGKNAR